MFRALGRFTTRRAWLVITVWILILLVAGSASIMGFGHGGLFQRMETSEYKVPDTDSTKVMDLTQSTEETGPTGILVVTGVDLDDSKVADVANDSRHLLESAHVESVTDAFAVAQMRQEAEEKAAAQVKDEIAKQIDEAMKPLEKQINKGADDAKKAIQAQIDAAAAMGAQAKAAAEAQAKPALAEVDAQTSAALKEAKTKVTTEVTKAVNEAAAEASESDEAVAAREEAEKLEASLLSSEGDGYAVVVARRKVGGQGGNKRVASSTR